MRRLRRSWIACLAIVVIGCASACGGSAANGTTPSPETPDVPVATPSAVIITATSTPAAYAFPEKGYSVTAPAGWFSQPAALYDVAGASFPTDLFVAPAQSGGIEPSVAISCLKPREDQATTEQYRDGWQNFIKLISGVDVEPSATTVNGSAAFLFKYSQAQANGEPLAADRTDVVFVAGSCRWMITLLVPTGEDASYSPALQLVMDSFRLITN